LIEAFIAAHDVALLERRAIHGGTGPIAFRRLGGNAFASDIDFLDVSSIPPGSSIGRHRHLGSEELYYILAGLPMGDALRQSSAALVKQHARGGRLVSRVDATTSRTP